MGQIIDIGTKINLDILLRSKLYIQADSGGGKSYPMRKTVESVGSKVQRYFNKYMLWCNITFIHTF